MELATTKPVILELVVGELAVAELAADDGSRADSGGRASRGRADGIADESDWTYRRRALGPPHKFHA